MTTTKGRCLCGAVTFEFEGPPIWTTYCHCESCRRATSSPMTALFGVPRTAYRFTGKAPKVFASSPGVQRSFCEDCGSPVTYETDLLDADIYFFVAALEDPNGLAPTTHVFYGERLAWFACDDGLPKYEVARAGFTSLSSGNTAPEKDQ